jgi:argininosuccinate synthase
VNWKNFIIDDNKIFTGAVSGGLDSCTITHWLSSNDIDVHCYTVDLGQPDEENIDFITERMLGCGAKEAFVIDAQTELAQAGLKVIQSQAKYEGGYWNTTGIARPVTVMAILKEMKKHETQILFHGATGRGNDQVRFQLSANMIDPSVQVYAPWRDQEFLNQFPGRRQMIEYCEYHSLPIKPSSQSRYSTDANFLGLTHEAGDLENININPEFVATEMGVWPWDASDIPEYVSVTWEEGIPVAINDQHMSLIEIFKSCNQIAGTHGVGIGTHVIENRFVGIKSRGIYESPGMELLGQVYEFILQFILDRRSREYFTDLSNLVSKQIYQGYWLDLTTASTLAAIDTISKLVTGTISVKLYKGGIYFDTAVDTDNNMPFSLYTNDGSMEDEGGYDHLDAEGFLNVLGVSAKHVGKIQSKGY